MGWKPESNIKIVKTVKTAKNQHESFNFHGFANIK